MQRNGRSLTNVWGAQRLASIGLAVWVALLGHFSGTVGAASGQDGSESSNAEPSDKAVDYSWVPELKPEDKEFPGPPDGKWLVDENGVEYTLYKWRKYDGYYKWVDEAKGLVKLRHLMVMQVEHHDDEFFYFRNDRTDALNREFEEKRLAQEDADRGAAATYRTDLPEQDRLRFEPWEQGLPKNAQWRNGFEIADINGDGHLDIVHGPPRKGPATTPVIFLGDGAGHWSVWQETRFPILPYDYGDVAVGDLDSDGDYDLVLGAHLTGIMALVGDGKGGFEPWSQGLPLRASAVERLAELEKPKTAEERKEEARVRHETRLQRVREGKPSEPGLSQLGPDGTPLEPKEPVGFASRAVALADWNRDGRLDILALSEGPTSVKDITDGVASPRGKIVYLNQGDGTWREQVGPGAALGDDIQPIDLDRDGLLDFVTDSAGVGNGQLVNRGAGESWEAVWLPDVRGRLIVPGIAVSDFDGNGLLDLALAFRSTEGKVTRTGIDIYFGVQPSANAANEPVPPGQSPAFAWRRESVFGTDALERTRRIAAGDLDSDGDVDLVTLTSMGRLAAFVNDGKGSFQQELSPELDPAPEHIGCEGYSAELVDLDGDGKPELVAGFAGESGSEVLLGERPYCRSGGALRVWKVLPAAAGQSGGAESSTTVRQGGAA